MRASLDTHAYSNRKFIRRSDERPKEMSTAKAWIEWGPRNTVDRLTYQPAAPLFTRREAVGGRQETAFNVWKGWGVEPKAGSVRPWTELLDHLFKDAPAERAWFERWCAYPIQHPGTKLFTAAVLWGTSKGTGKTIVAECLRRIYGDGENAVIVDQDALSRSFNGALANRQFVHGDEITADDSRRYADKLKGYITNERIRINEKFVPEYEIDTCANYYFTSNHPDAFFLEDGDRRFFIHEVRVAPLPDEFYERLREWKAGDGPAALFHHLLHLDLGDFNPRAQAPMTAAKQEMLRDSKSDVGRWIHDLAETGQAPGIPPDVDLLTPAELLNAYDPGRTTKVTDGRIGKELKAMNFPPRRLRAGDPRRLYAVRNWKKWADAEDHEWAAHRKAKVKADEDRRAKKIRGGR